MYFGREQLHIVPNKARNGWGNLQRHEIVRLMNLSLRVPFHVSGVGDMSPPGCCCWRHCYRCMRWGQFLSWFKPSRSPFRAPHSLPWPPSPVRFEILCWLGSVQGIKGAWKSWQWNQTRPPMLPTSQPTLQSAPGEGGTTGGNHMEADTEMTSSGHSKLK